MPSTRMVALGDDLLGDRIDPHMGALSFEHTDVSLPGNSALPVAIGRRRSQGQLYDESVDVDFGDWELLVPKIHAVHIGWDGWQWGPARCSAHQLDNFPRDDTNPRRLLYWFDYTNGVQIDIPGVTSGHLLDRRSSQAPHLPNDAEHATTDGTYATCLSNITGGGEGFRVVTPTGAKYDFDRVIVRRYKHIGAPTQRGSVWFRKKTLVVATKATDVHGNWVRWDYDSRDRLTAIHASDGRRIELRYRSGSDVIWKAIANPRSVDERTWTYAYRDSRFSWMQFTGGHGAKIDASALDTVTLPDGTAWSFDLDQMAVEPFSGECHGAGGRVSLTHPNGVTGTFGLEETVHRHASWFMVEDEDQPCLGLLDNEPPPYTRYPTPPVFVGYGMDIVSVKRKKLTGPGLADRSWKYEYESDRADDTSQSDPTNWTKITDPAGHVTTFYHYWPSPPISGDYADFGGKLAKVERRTSEGGTVLQSTEHTYVREAALGYAVKAGGTPPAAYPIRGRDTTVRRGSDWYKTKWTFALDRSATDYSHGHPTQVDVWSNTAGSWNGRRTTTTSYVHLTDRWVLGLTDQVRKGDASSTKLFDDYDYDGKGRVERHERFGELVSTVAWHTSGVQAGRLKSVTDALSRTTSYDDWHRGVPRTVTRADGKAVTREVDLDGQVTRFLSAGGTPVSYRYDDAGRLTRIMRPSPWDDTEIGYSGLGSGLTQTIKRGPKTETIEYDAMLRPGLVREQATSRGSGSIYSYTAYDALGRVSFQSWPQASDKGSLSDWKSAGGALTTYDALGRPLTMAETVTPFATTVTSYPRGSIVEVTDPEGHLTRTELDAWGDPDAGQAYRIDQYEGTSALLSSTQMAYDDYGNLRTARQFGSSGGVNVTEYQRWRYDGQLRLCRHWTPETGSRLYGYDAAGQLEREGHVAGSWSDSCPAIADDLVLTNDYDDLGRLESVDYADGTPDVGYGYGADSNLESLTKGGTAWRYDWFETGDGALLRSETLELDAGQANAKAWTGRYEYHPDGALKKQHYPSGLEVLHYPDGHGRSTSARKAGGTWYARYGGYHANGMLESFDYGNGYQFDQSLNDRQLPEQRKVRLPGVRTAMNQRYEEYDANGRITRIDALYDEFDRAYGYDGMGRLVSAEGPWGAGSYAYDALGNLRKKTLGPKTVEMRYHGNNRLWGYRGVFQSGNTNNRFRDFLYEPSKGGDRGNVTDDGLNSLTYDLSDRAVRVGNADGTVTAHRYDGHGRRVKQTNTDRTIYSFYGLGGTLLHREAEEGGAVTKTDYVRMGGELVAKVADGVPTYVHGDHLGSPVVETRANGSVKSRTAYTPYGEEVGGPSPSPWDDDAGYTGHVKDAASGLTHMQARQMNPVVGRFYGNDPVGFAEGGPGYFGRYSYTMNDPVNAWDPDGRECVTKDTTTCGSSGGANAATAATTITSIVANEGIGAQSARNSYNNQVTGLDPNDSAGRSAAKTAARNATPPITRGVIEGSRPGTGPRAGSGGTANRTNTSANNVAKNLGRVGRASAATNVVVGTARVATSDTPGREAAIVGGETGGALAGAWGGAQLGAFGGPWGAAGGSIVGGVVGGFGGGAVMERAVGPASPPDQYGASGSW